MHGRNWTQKPIYKGLGIRTGTLHAQNLYGLKYSKTYDVSSAIGLIQNTSINVAPKITDIVFPDAMSRSQAPSLAKAASTFKLKIQSILKLPEAMREL